MFFIRYNIPKISLYAFMEMIMQSFTLLLRDRPEFHYSCSHRAVKHRRYRTCQASIPPVYHEVCTLPGQ